MSKWFCFTCFGNNDEDSELVVMDLVGKELIDVPSSIFLYERTLETLLLSSNRIKDLPLPLFHCEALTTLIVDNNYIQSLPPAIGALVNLQILDISRNCISYISDDIKSCKKLTQLNLSMNPIGQFPEGVTHLIFLEKLYMSGTMIDFIPANIGRLARLRIFELRDNVITTLPKAFARLTSLICLDIGYNDFTELPEPVGELYNLEHLWMEGNEIEELPPFINGLANLVNLDVTNTDITMISKNIGALTKLVNFTLSNAKLKILPTTVGRLKNLVTLRLDDNELRSLPQTIGYLENLEELFLSLNRLESIPSSIGLLRKLIYLDLSYNCIKKIPSEIGSCVSLHILVLPNNLLQTVPAEIGNLVNLKVCNFINNRLQYLPMSVLKLQNLKALWLSHNQVKPLTPLLKDLNLETNTSVLTCYLLPQRDSFSDESSATNAQDNKKESNSNSEEHHQSRPRIRFSIDPLLDKQSHLTRSPTPYPRRLRSLARTAQNITQTSQHLMEDDVMPVVNLSNNWNRGDEVRLAVVKKQISSQMSASIESEHLSGITLHQPPPYHIAAMNSKHASYFQNSDWEEGLPDEDFEALKINENAFGDELSVTESVRSVQFTSSDDELFSNYVNQNLFVNQNLPEKKYVYNNEFPTTSRQDKSELQSRNDASSALQEITHQSTNVHDQKLSVKLNVTSKNIEKPIIAGESENNFEYQPERQIDTSHQLLTSPTFNVNSNTEECNYSVENQSDFQCEAEVHQILQMELDSDDYSGQTNFTPETIAPFFPSGETKSVTPSTSTVETQHVTPFTLTVDKKTITPSTLTVEKQSTTPTLMDKKKSIILSTSADERKLIIPSTSADEKKSITPSILTDENKSISPSTLTGGKKTVGTSTSTVEQKCITSSTLAVEESERKPVLAVRGRFSVSHYESKLSVDYDQLLKQERAEPDVSKTISAEPDEIKQEKAAFSEDFNWDFNESDKSKSLEDIASQTPTSTPADFFSERVSHLRAMFEKKISAPVKNRSPWFFGVHKNATVIEVTIMKKNFELGFQLDFQKSGIFVKDVNPGSPASEVLCQGDKILQVDGINLPDNINLDELVCILEDFTRPFTMMISRI